MQIFLTLMDVGKEGSGADGCVAMVCCSPSPFAHFLLVLCKEILLNFYVFGETMKGYQKGRSSNHAQKAKNGRGFYEISF